MSKEEKLSIKLNDNDNVATVLRDIKTSECTQDINAINPIPKGHKISLKNISKGDKIT